MIPSISAEQMQMLVAWVVVFAIFAVASVLAHLAFSGRR